MTTTRKVGAGWLILLSFIGQATVWAALLSQYGDSREMDGRCAASAPEEAVRIGENPQVTADVTLIPTGRACIYDDVDGGTIIVQTGQSVTVATLVGTVVCLLSAAGALAFWRRVSPMQRTLPGIALLLLGLGRLTIWQFAALW